MKERPMFFWASKNQTDVHYAMPVRNAIYDALQYGRQVADIAAGHRRNKMIFREKIMVSICPDF